MDNFQKQLGARLRNIRIAKNYSIEELSHKADLHPAHLGKIERGEQNFTVNTLHKIVQALGVSYVQVFDFEQELRPSTNPYIEKTLSYLSTMTIDEQRHIYKTVQMLSSKK